MPDGTVITDVIPGRTWTANGTAAVSSGELVVDGSAGAYLGMTHEDAIRDLFNGATGTQWTIEFKAVPITVSGQNPFFAWRESSSDYGLAAYAAGGTPTQFDLLADDSGGGSWEVFISAVGALAAATPVEIAFTRDGGSFYVHINGALAGSDSYANGLLDIGDLGPIVGALSSADTGSGIGDFTMRRLRMTAGIARYGASSYTPEAGDDYPESLPPLEGRASFDASPLAQPATLASQLFGQTAEGSGALGDPSAFGSLLFGVASAPGLLSSPISFLGYHDFSGLLTGNESIGYVLDLETPSGTRRVGMKNWQGTLQTERSNYVQCTIDAAQQWQAEISDATGLVISRVAELDGVSIEYVMATVTDITIRDYYRGPKTFSCVIGGYSEAFLGNDDPPAGLDRDLQGVRSTRIGTTSTNARCSVDFLLRPGQRAWVDDTSSFIVDYINYYCVQEGVSIQEYMDVGTRS